MILARVVGTVVATRKDDKLQGKKLLVVRPVGPDGKPTGSDLIAVDAAQAGFRETVLVVQGSSARLAAGLRDAPVDAAVVGIVDTVDVDDVTAGAAGAGAAVGAGAKAAAR